MKSMRLLRSLVAVAVFAPLAIGGALFAAACGMEWFPKCNQPGNKCPPVAPGEDPVPYPSKSKTDAGAGIPDTGVDG